eukprot:EG_transcript_10776
MSLFDEPVLLDCAHNVCLNCAQQLYEFQSKIEELNQSRRLSSATAQFHTGIKCPECRQFTSTSEGVAGLKRNVTLRNLVCRLKVEKKGADMVLCGNCEEETASFACRECGFELCPDCKLTQHQRGKYKSHTIVPLGEWSKSKPELCPLHCKDLDLYCLKDECAVCIYCLQLSGEHRDHQVVGLADAVQRAKGEVANLVAQAQQRVAGLSQSVAHRKSLLAKVEGDVDELCQRIDSYFAELTDVVAQQHQRLIEEARGIGAARVTFLGEETGKMSSVAEQLQETVAKCQGLVQEYPDAELLRHRNRLMNRLQAVCEVVYTDHPSTVPVDCGCRFVEDRAVLQAIQSIRCEEMALSAETVDPSPGFERPSAALSPTVSPTESSAIISLKVGDDEPAAPAGQWATSGVEVEDGIRITLMGDLSQATQDAAPVISLAGLFEDEPRKGLPGRKRKARSPARPPAKVALPAGARKWELKI